MLLVSILFLFAIMFQTRRSNVPVWKDSALALWLLEVDQNVQDRVKGKRDQPGDLENEVGNVKVVLGEGLGGSGFRVFESK
jgi:hypothetical protein